MAYFLLNQILMYDVLFSRKHVLASVRLEMVFWGRRE
jgi:hypothetical protein